MTPRSVLAAVVENVVAPLAVYGLLTLAGLGAVGALLASAGFSALVVGVRALRTGRVPMLGLLVGLHFLLGVAIAGLTGDARLMLAKEALGTLVSAAAMGTTLLVGTPFLARIHRDLSSDPGAFDRRWSDDVAFRADHRRVTAVWAASLVVAAGAVVAASLLPPLPVAVVASHAIPVPGYLALIAWTARRFRRRAPELHGGGAAVRVAPVSVR